MLKSTILSAVTFMFLFVVWTITPAQAHIGVPCPHKDLTHQHCDGDESVRTLEDLNCTADQIPKYDGAQWGCATDTTAETECPDGHALLGDGSCVDVNGLVHQLLQLRLGVDVCAVGIIPTSGPFVDNCDGTITDTGTGLMWEKKVSGPAGRCLDSDKLHSISATCNWFDATGGWIVRMNVRCNDDPTVDCSAGGDSDCSGVGGQCGFAGYTDWRVPEVALDGGTAELETILLAACPEGGVPCIDPIFGPTAASIYWSATTLANFPTSAWRVDFFVGGILDSDKFSSFHVRAVRGP